MKRNVWIFGGVVFVHGVVLLLFQGCRTPPAATDGRIQRPAPPRLETDPPHPVETRVTPVPVPTTPPPALPRPAPREAFPEPTTAYTVQPGDTLSAIAYRYKLTVDSILALNRMDNPDRIRVGQTLQLPGRVDLSDARSLPEPTPTRAARTPAGGAPYEVKAGDTLSGIALRYRVAVDDLRRVNNLRGDRILVGQTLVIPGAAPEQPATPAPATPPRTTPQPQPPPLVPGIETDDRFAPPPPVEEPDPVLPDEAALPAPTYEIVTVGPEDNLMKLAAKWNVSVLQLRQLNGLTGDAIPPGTTTLRIPKGP